MTHLKRRVHDGDVVRVDSIGGDCAQSLNLSFAAPGPARGRRRAAERRRAVHRHHAEGDRAPARPPLPGGRAARLERLAWSRRREPRVDRPQRHAGRRARRRRRRPLLQRRGRPARLQRSHRPPAVDVIEPVSRETVLLAAQERLGFDDLRPGQLEAVQAVVAGRDTLVRHVDRLGQVGDLPARRLPHRRPDRRRLAAHRAPAGPDGGGRGGGRRPELDAHRPPARGGHRGRRRRRRRVRPARARAARQRGGPRGAAPRPASPLRRRRGALRQRSGATTSAPTTCALGPAIEALGHPPVLALTATAAPPVRDEIVEVLGMRDPEVIVRGFDRPNIRLEVERHEDADRKRRALLDRVEEAERPGHRLLRDEEGRRGGRRRAARRAACGPSTTTAA